MVGHTGVIPAVITAVETVDACLGRVVDAVHAAGGVCLVTADHGNAEVMLETDGTSPPHGPHTTNPVPLIVTNSEVKVREGELFRPRTNHFGDARDRESLTNEWEERGRCGPHNAAIMGPLVTAPA